MARAPCAGVSGRVFFGLGRVFWPLGRVFRVGSGFGSKITARARPVDCCGSKNTARAHPPRSSGRVGSGFFRAGWVGLFGSGDPCPGLVNCVLAWLQATLRLADRCNLCTVYSIERTHRRIGRIGVPRSDQKPSASNQPSLSTIGSPPVSRLVHLRWRWRPQVATAVRRAWRHQSVPRWGSAR